MTEHHISRVLDVITELHSATCPMDIYWRGDGGCTKLSFVWENGIVRMSQPLLVFLMPYYALCVVCETDVTAYGYAITDQTVRQSFYGKAITTDNGRSCYIDGYWCPLAQRDAQAYQVPEDKRYYGTSEEVARMLNAKHNLPKGEQTVLISA